ncbi:MAG: OB-fold putative lipoprotein [Treponema sp.]|jgi:hypothetical protein|nr:OB-fold putative lipoprotein [Treponema sp.]
MTNIGLLYILVLEVYDMNKIMTCIIFLFGINIISCASTGGKSSGSAAIPENEIIITDQELMNEFLNNETQALQKYKGKRIAITGTIFEKAAKGITSWPVNNPPPKDFNYIIFGDYNNIGIGVQCNFNEHIYFSVNKGETITVSGNFREINYANDTLKIVVIGECKTDNN